MTKRDLATQWRDLHKEVSRHAIESKVSNDALRILENAYRALSLEERRLIDDVLIEDLLSEDELWRFDAQVLVDEFKIKSAIPALVELTRKLEGRREPSSHFESKRVSSLIDRLRSK